MSLHATTAAYASRRTALFLAFLAAGLGMAESTPALALGSIQVSNCHDTGVGSLRSAVQMATDGDTIDLSPIVSPCTITLETGAIAITTGHLSIAGPTNVHVTIDGNHSNRLFYHYYSGGEGRLSLNQLTLSNGSVSTATRFGLWAGGCIYSNGSVYLSHSIMEHCEATASFSTLAAGGAIFARKGVSLAYSTITGNTCSATGTSNAFGGAVFTSGYFSASQSSLTGNSTISANHHDSGGAVYASGQGDFSLRSMLIANNTSSFAAVWVYSGSVPAFTNVIDSTISGNHSIGTAGLTSYLPVEVWSSTIASNTSVNNVAAGLFAGSSLKLHSTLLADNISQGSSQNLYDVQLDSGGSISGENNLITATGAGKPEGTITACPLLGPLADNGGPTFTQAIDQNSPALDSGESFAFILFDQRGFPREFGPQTDIGAYEWQGEAGDRIFFGEFENRCQ